MPGRKHRAKRAACARRGSLDTKLSDSDGRLVAVGKRRKARLAGSAERTDGRMVRHSGESCVMRILLCELLAST